MKRLLFVVLFVTLLCGSMARAGDVLDGIQAVSRDLEERTVQRPPVDQGEVAELRTVVVALKAELATLKAAQTVSLPKRVKQSPCSPSCTCGCNETGVCSCSQPQFPQVVHYQPAYQPVYHAAPMRLMGGGMPMTGGFGGGMSFGGGGGCSSCR